MPHWFIATVTSVFLLATTVHAESTPSGASPTTRETNKELAPTIFGATGLFRTLSAFSPGDHNFHIGFHAEFFKAKDFLVLGDDNTHFTGTVGLGYSPFEYLEVFANIRSQANDNKRQDPQRKDPQVALSLGDIFLGLKGQYPVFTAWGIGAQFGAQLLNSAEGVGVKGNATSFNFGLLSTVDLHRATAVPIRFHTNVGFIIDRSNNLADLSRYDLASLHVQKYTLGISPSRVQIRVGLEGLLRRWVQFGLAPIVEAEINVATGAADSDFVSRISADGFLTTERINGRLSALLTVGLRVNPVAGLQLVLASDIGLKSPGYGFGPPVTPWNLIAGLSYAYDPTPPTRVVTQPRVVEAAAVPQGRIAGRVYNATTRDPIEAAVVSFEAHNLTALSTDAQGNFVSYDFPSGTVTVSVRGPGFHPVTKQVQIQVNKTTQIDLAMQPQAPATGRAGGRVSDATGNGIAATVSVVGTDKAATAESSGAFNIELPPGDFTLRFEAPNYFRKELAVHISAGETTTAAVMLSLRPKKPQVRITSTALIIGRPVHFELGTANLSPDSSQLLDEVAAVLLENTNIAKIEVGGHTDNRGGIKRNETLSQARAEAVRGYLMSAGVPAARLEARGYGPHKPQFPNLTARNRARNRRVEFKILEQK